MPRFLSLAPILPTADLTRVADHYRLLGFDVRVHDGGYGTASRDGFNLHFHQLDEPVTVQGSGAVYFAVDDAEALHRDWVASGVGETSDLFDPGFGVREGAHTEQRHQVRFAHSVTPREAPGGPPALDVAGE